MQETQVLLHLVLPVKFISAWGSLGHSCGRNAGRGTFDRQKFAETGLNLAGISDQERLERRSLTMRCRGQGLRVKLLFPTVNFCKAKDFALKVGQHQLKRRVDGRSEHFNHDDNKIEEYF